MTANDDKIDQTTELHPDGIDNFIDNNKPDNEAEDLYAAPKGGMGKPGKGYGRCWECGEWGHTRRECFKFAARMGGKEVTWQRSRVASTREKEKGKESEIERDRKKKGDGKGKKGKGNGKGKDGKGMERAKEGKVQMHQKNF